MADLLNASAVQSSAADGLVVADGLLLAIESTLTARDLLAPSCFNGRSRGLQRDIRAKKKGLQPQGVASVPDNRSSSSNSVLGRKARKPKAMIYTCSLPEVDVEKRALMQGKERSGLTSLASLPVASASESNLERSVRHSQFTSLSSSNKIVMLVVTLILIAPSKWLQD
nr:hypothetical protein [Tanacetum cinerariifolium]